MPSYPASLLYPPETLGARTVMSFKVYDCHYTPTMDPPKSKKIYNTLEELRAANRESSARYRERKRAEATEPPRPRGRPPLYSSPEEAKRVWAERKRERRAAARQKSTIEA